MQGRRTIKYCSSMTILFVLSALPLHAENDLDFSAFPDSVYMNSLTFNNAQKSVNGIYTYNISRIEENPTQSENVEVISYNNIALIAKITNSTNSSINYLPNGSNKNDWNNLIQELKAYPKETTIINYTMELIQIKEIVSYVLFAMVLFMGMFAFRIAILAKNQRNFL